MKNVSLVLSSLSFLGVVVLFGLFFSTNKKDVTHNNVVPVTNVNNGSLRVGYLNIDSLEAHYDLLKTKREEFKRRQAQMEAELTRSYQQMQSDAEEIQKKAQSNSLTQSEYESAQKRLMQMEKSLETRKQSLTEEFMKEQDDFNKALKARLDSLIAEYNLGKHFDYVLSYSGSNSALLLVNSQFDITKDVTAAMNATAKEKK